MAVATPVQRNQRRISSYGDPQQQEYVRGQDATLKAQQAKQQALSSGASEQEAHAAGMRAYESSMGGATTSTPPYVEAYNKGGSPPNISTAEPGQMAEQDRIFAYGRGEQLNDQIGGRVGGENEWQEYYRQRGNEQYDPILSGRGGYSPEQTAGILQYGSMPTPMSQQDTDALQLTGAEQSDIRGNPQGAMDFWRPDYVGSISNEGNRNVRSAYQGSADQLQGAIDPGNLRLADDYTSGQYGVLDASDAGVRGAITDRLRMDGGFEAGLQGDIGTGEANVRGAVTDRLRQDPGFADKYRMTEGQVQALKDKAGRNVMFQKQAALDDIEQRAVASGNVSPTAMAALRDRYENTAQANSADAMSDAGIRADAERASREMNIEGNRQDAERGYAGLKADTEMGMLRNRADTRLATEGLRQQGERSYADMKSGSEFDMGSRRSGVMSDAEKMRIASEQGLTDRQLQAGTTAGNWRVDAEDRIAGRDLDVADRTLTRGADLYRGADDRSSERAGYVASNRQDVGQYGQQTGFNQGLQVNDRQSDRNRVVADARRGDEQEARGWLSGQQTQASNNVNTGNTQSIQNYGAQTQAGQNATGTAAEYDLARRGLGFGTAFKRGFGNALGSFLGGGAGFKPSGGGGR